MPIRWFSFLFLCGIIYSGCETKQFSELKIENDSLRRELEFRSNMILAMEEVHMVTDSILNNYANYPDSVHFNKYLERIEYLHRSLTSSDHMLKAARAQLNQSQDEASAYNLMVAALQDEVSLRDKEIDDKHAIIQRNSKNHKSNVATLEKAIADRDRELQKLKETILEIRRVNAAETYFIKAQRLEEKARKVYFAPRKRKDTFREAIELYKKSLQYGKVEAEMKIKELKRMA